MSKIKLYAVAYETYGGKLTPSLKGQGHIRAESAENAAKAAKLKFLPFNRKHFGHTRIRILNVGYANTTESMVCTCGHQYMKHNRFMGDNKETGCIDCDCRKFHELR